MQFALLARFQPKTARIEGFSDKKDDIDSVPLLAGLVIALLIKRKMAAMVAMQANCQPKGRVPLVDHTIPYEITTLFEHPTGNNGAMPADQNISRVTRTPSTITPPIASHYQRRFPSALRA